jgi:hypothetical protein
VNLVPRHAPRALASAHIGRHGGRVQRIGQGFRAHNELGDHHLFFPSVDFLCGEQGEPVAPAADILDVPQPRHKGIGYGKQFEQFPSLVHASDLRSRPRADRPSNYDPLKYASGSRNSNRNVSGHGFAAVNPDLARAS